MIHAECEEWWPSQRGITANCDLKFAPCPNTGCPSASISSDAPSAARCFASVLDMVSLIDTVPSGSRELTFLAFDEKVLLAKSCVERWALTSGSPPCRKVSEMSGPWLCWSPKKTCQQQQTLASWQLQCAKCNHRSIELKSFLTRPHILIRFGTGHGRVPDAPIAVEV